MLLKFPLSFYGSTAPVGLSRFFGFLVYTQSVGLLGRGSASRKTAAYTQNNTNTELTHTDIHASGGIRTTILVFELTKTIHALD
jgi:hypothetical protein